MAAEMKPKFPLLAVSDADWSEAVQCGVVAGTSARLSLPFPAVV